MQPHAATKGGFKILEQKIGRKTARNGRQSPWGKKPLRTYYGVEIGGVKEADHPTPPACGVQEQHS